MNKVIFVLLGLLALPAQAQLLTGVTENTEAPPLETTAPEEIKSIATGAPTISSEAPLEITADNTLEWQRNEKTFIARGNALAKQGDSSVAAATLTAHYSDAGGGMKVSRVIANDNVVIKSRDAEAFGAQADYDLDKGYAVMTGENLRMVSPEQEVTAREKFEYWVTDGKFIAIGDAKVKRGTDTLQATRIAAVMKNDAQGKRVLDMLEARDNVVITTPTEKVTGTYAIYHAASNMAEIKGNVKISRGPNVLEGERAEVDMTTRTSRIFGSAANGGRVKGVFYPGSDKKNP
jgi:lipopolysaccharide export system protein LptA